jgi:hypothetical protein
VCVVSNIDRADIEAAIDYHGLKFDHVVTSEDAKSPGPPEVSLRAEVTGLSELADLLKTG